MSETLFYLNIVKLLTLKVCNVRGQLFWDIKRKVIAQQIRQCRASSQISGISVTKMMNKLLPILSNWLLRNHFQRATSFQPCIRTQFPWHWRRIKTSCISYHPISYLSVEKLTAKLLALYPDQAVWFIYIFFIVSFFKLAV